MPNNMTISIAQSSREAQQSRRQFLGQAALLAGSACCGSRFTLAADELAASKANRPKVAAIVTEFTYRAHAHVILENFLEPYLFNGELHRSPVDVVSLFADQFPAGEIGRKVAGDYKIPIFPTIDEALCLGTGELAVGQCAGPERVSAQALFRRDGQSPAAGEALRAGLQRQASVVSLGLGQGDVRYRARAGHTADGRQLGSSGAATALPRIAA
jgi:hypothetical protein